ncbi:Nibrin [Mizuhopecten yessoensis]|uniref:Nibrin n=1 Tax=Mizuhopecten yessoensis TaxID=6573 RepID=A0A210PUW6_MIZYE|nr:Nibrin [Mizuhopecten yessoensis]
MTLDKRYVLLVGKSYIVGRKDCEILVENDAAVSRKHAELTVTHPETNLNKPTLLPTLTVKDLSKYGTMVNENKVQGQVTVKDGDEVVFGSPKSAFIAVYEPLVVSTSCLSPNLKKQVRQTVLRLGGHIVAEWSRHCTLLVMTSISVTIKVVCAMVSLKSIVSPDYLDAYLQSLETGKEQPDAESYLPTVSESQVDPTEVSFTNNPERKKIFQGKTFIFLQQKQFQKMSLAVELGGGMPLLMETRPQGRGDEAVLTHKDTIVMNCGPDAGPANEWTEWYKYMEKLLDRHKRHMSQDAELGLAVLHCDTEQYCNPCVDFASQMVSRLPSQSLSQAPVFTQTETENRGVKQEKTTPPPTTSKPPCVKSSPAPLSVKGRESQRIKGPSQGDQDTATTSTARGQISQAYKSQNSSLKQKSRSPSPKKQQDTSKMSPLRRSPRSRSPSPVPVTSKTSNLRSRSPAPADLRSRSPAPPDLRSSSSSPAPPVSKRINMTLSSVPEVVTSNSASPVTKKGGKGGPKNTRNNSPEIVVVKKEKVVRETKTRPGKRQIIEDESDEDYGFTRKSKRKRDSPDEVDNEDDPFDWSSRKSAAKTSSKSERGLKVEKDEDIVIEDSESETEDYRGKMSRSNKGQEVRVSDSDSDSGVKWTSKGKNRSPKGRKGQQTKDVVELVEESQKIGQKKRKLDDSSDEEDQGHRSRRKIKEEPGISTSPTSSRGRQGNTRVEEQEQTDRQEMVTKQERITPRKPISDRTVGQEKVQAGTRQQEQRMSSPSLPGFLSAVRGQNEDENNHHGIYVKEEGIPTDLVQTVFLDLVTRRPSRPQNSPERSGGDVPPGYSRWKGSIVKNFKKFKKAGFAGLDRLPNIIGGSDLVPHAASQRRELDEWFKEAQEAESQHSEANRRAQELFEWEPRSHSNNRSR